jgi:hypothetical protein
MPLSARCGVRDEAAGRERRRQWLGRRSLQKGDQADHPRYLWHDNDWEGVCLDTFHVMDSNNHRIKSRRQRQKFLKERFGDDQRWVQIAVTDYQRFVALVRGG